ncbi:hypothetical protein RHMOL_Rhmol13G0197300 [Rhododendron molle]|uniref:Uncharacterized protein n=1 Tax=Rhododendron molle TaxID=49168 RepID=A0ACC0LA74_RHOML|nr:hypothetical protein RHMOL_Rhmol13G0197300 [Rhododendron molle]
MIPTSLSLSLSYGGRTGQHITIPKKQAETNPRRATALPSLKTVAKAGITWVYVNDFNLGVLFELEEKVGVLVNEDGAAMMVEGVPEEFVGLVLAGSDTGLSWFALWFFPVAFGLPNMKSHLLCRQVSESKFYYLKNEAILLEMAHINCTITEVMRRGFTPLITPEIVRPSVVEKCGFQPRGENTQVNNASTSYMELQYDCVFNAKLYVMFCDCNSELYFVGSDSQRRTKDVLVVALGTSLVLGTYLGVNNVIEVAHTRSFSYPVALLFCLLLSGTLWTMLATVPQYVVALVTYVESFLFVLYTSWLRKLIIGVMSCVRSEVAEQSGDVSRSVSGLVFTRYEIYLQCAVQVTNNPKDYAMDDIVKDADRLVSCFANKVAKTFDFSIGGASSMSCKYVLNALMHVIYRHAVKESTLNSLVIEILLLLWLLDERVPRMDDGGQLLKALNVLMLKIVVILGNESQVMRLLNRISEIGTTCSRGASADYGVD